MALLANVPEGYLSIAQAGLRAHKSYNQILKLIMRASVHGYQDDRGRWWVSVGDLDRYLAECDP